jgi:NitT/TauT family transport system ATP-binding protein
LSGGMRKRVSLACTLVSNPGTILMDEPFSALDVQTRNMMENELLGIWARDNKTVIFVTHDLEEAIALSDVVIVMTARPGRIKSVREIKLPRPRDILDIRLERSFHDLYTRLWEDMRDEVRRSYEQQTSAC